MIASLAGLFRPDDRASRRPPIRRRPSAWCYEQLEPRQVLAVTVGSQGFADVGGTSTNTGNVDTATVFTIGNFLSTGSQQGYFLDLPLQFLGSFSFDVNVGTSLSFANASFGTFSSTQITETSNEPGERSFDVLGTYVGGTFGGPTTPNPAIASLTISFTQTPPGAGAISCSATLSIPPAQTDMLVAADDIGCVSTPRVYVINPSTGVVDTSFVAYADPSDARFRGGVRVAVGDVDGNPLTLEIVTAPGPGRLGQIRVFDLAGVEKPGFRLLPFGSSYTSGIELAIGDVDGDGRGDLVAAASRGRGSVVTALSTGSAFVPNAQRSFTAFAAPYTGGATVAVAGVNRIVVGSGIGMRPTVRTYDVSGASPTFTQFLPSLPTGTGGVWVTTQNFLTGTPQIMVSGGAGAGSRVGVYQNQANPPVRSFATFASRPKPNSPVHAAAISLLGGTVDTVFMSQGTGGRGGILKVNAATGAVDTSFAPQYASRTLAGPLRIATRGPRPTT